MKDSIIIADDDPQIIIALKLLLQAEGFEVTAVTNPMTLLDKLKTQEYALALIDLNYQTDTTSGAEGLQLISDIKKLDELLPIIVMTGYSSVDIAVDAMKKGAADFITKPWKNDRLLAILSTQIKLRDSELKGQKLHQHNTLLRDEQLASHNQLIAQSASMQQLLSQVRKLAKSDMNILFTGENGTGKSLLADYLHQHSVRHQQPFISVNMGALSESLFESEMFGHVKGAFTDAKNQRIGRFELADNGTIFLDEIANISLIQQAKLLRVLEEKQFEKLGSSKTQRVNVRVVSATNSSLNDLVDNNQFRQDLLYRLNTVEIHIPSLRDRVADIVPLAESFLITFAKKYQLPQPVFVPDALIALQNYQWPGNIRELNHMIERAIFMCADGEITVNDLGINQENCTTSSNSILNNGISSNSHDFSSATLDEIEYQVITERLALFQHKPIETAESLGLSRSSYYRRIEKYKL
ncbi:MAG: sigma-54 dependent transcriptional regulator [Colwellia sp.]|nr:sigma-54 dependent transcriptional regulator [Colwellia sp.]